MGSIVQPYLPPVILLDIKETLSIGLIGVLFAACVYGITVLQAYIYLGNSRQDSVYIRSFVAFLFILDTVSLVLAVETLYTYVVVDFEDPLQLINMPPALALENAATVLVGTLTQCFLAHRLWELSNHNKVLVYSVIILAFCSFGPGTALSVKLYTHRIDIIFDARSIEGRALGGVANGMSAVCDIVITAALCYYLHSKRTGFKRTNSIIDKLIVYAVNRGALTAICQAGEMIATITRPDRYIYLPFALLSGKLYVNTLLATLNAQKSLSNDGDNVVEVSMLPSSRADAPSLGSSVPSLGNTTEGIVIPPSPLDISRCSDKIVGYIKGGTHPSSIDSGV